MPIELKKSVDYPEGIITAFADVFLGGLANNMKSNPLDSESSRSLGKMCKITNLILLSIPCQVRKIYPSDGKYYRNETQLSLHQIYRAPFVDRVLSSIAPDIAVTFTEELLAALKQAFGVRAL